MINILLVEDNPADAERTRRMLAKAFGEEHHVDCAADWDEAVAGISSGRHDLCLVDYLLPGGHDGIELVAMGAEAMPMILLTGFDADEIDRAAEAAGAVNFLSKSELNGEMLGRAIRYALANKGQPSDRLPNAEGFCRELAEMLGEASQTPRLVAVIMAESAAAPSPEAARQMVARLRVIFGPPNLMGQLDGQRLVIAADHLIHPLSARVLARRAGETILRSLRLAPAALRMGACIIHPGAVDTAAAMDAAAKAAKAAPPGEIGIIELGA